MLVRDKDEEYKEILLKVAKLLASKNNFFFNQKNKN